MAQDIAHTIDVVVGLRRMVEAVGEDGEGPEIVMARAADEIEELRAEAKRLRKLLRKVQ